MEKKLRDAHDELSKLFENNEDNEENNKNKPYKLHHASNIRLEEVKTPEGTSTLVVAFTIADKEKSFEIEPGQRERVQNLIECEETFRTLLLF